MNTIADLDSLLNKLETEPFLLLGTEALEILLNQSEIVREEDTLISGMLRILKVGNTYLTQEITNRSDIILRKHPDPADAVEFFNERMDVYEKMWNGCGCKVNYYDES